MSSIMRIVLHKFHIFSHSVREHKGEIAFISYMLFCSLGIREQLRLKRHKRIKTEILMDAKIEKISKEVITKTAIPAG